MYVLEDNLMELVLFLYHVDGTDRTRVIGFGNVTKPFHRPPKRFLLSLYLSPNPFCLPPSFSPFSSSSSWKWEWAGSMALCNVYGFSSNVKEPSVVVHTYDPRYSGDWDGGGQSGAQINWAQEWKEDYWIGLGNLLRSCLKQNRKTKGEGGTQRGTEGREGNPTDN